MLLLSCFARRCELVRCWLFIRSQICILFVVMLICRSVVALAATQQRERGVANGDRDSQARQTSGNCQNGGASAFSADLKST